MWVIERVGMAGVKAGQGVARSKSLLPAAGHSLPLVVQQLDGVVQQLRGLQGEVGLSIMVNNTMKYDNMTIIVV